jgi:membrane-bound metal-dependent hydrolase YbcI (DUF457 family)
MADLLVHVASSFAVGRPLRDGRLRAILYLGVCLPDVLYKTLLYLGNAPSWLCEPTHSPLGLLPFCYVGALLFEEAWRKRAFAALLAGGWLHLLVDLGKNYLGSGVICWAFPFSMRRVELGWYNTEDTVRFMLPALAVMGVVELLFRRRRTSAPTPASP